MTLKKAMALRKGDQVYFAGSFYDFAQLREFPHGVMLGIYDEGRKSRHIDYLNPDSVSEVYSCPSCQGGGCPVCSGNGRVIA